LTNLLQAITEKPLDLGEVKFEYRSVGFQSRLVVRYFIAVQYAVSKERELINVQRLTLSGIHPYPIEFEKILNP
jgi:hypothetical protein